MKVKNIILGIVIIGIISATFHGLGLVKSVPWHIVFSDVLGFYDRVSAPGFPYLDKLMEYPVMTGVFIHLMGLLGKSRIAYYLWSSAFLIALAAAITYLLGKMGALENSLDKLKANRKRIFTFWIFAPSMIFFAIYNWDLLAIFFTVIAFYFIQRDKSGWASFFLALGFASKFFPIIYLAPLLLKKPGIKKWAKILAIFAVTAFVINAYFIMENFQGWSYFFTLNNLRDSNPDNIWTIGRFLFRGLDVPAINTLSLLLFSASYLFALIKFHRESILKLCFLGTLLFLIFNKVFSPQYLLWLLPFFVLLPAPKLSWFYTLEFSNLASLFLILPWFFLGHDIKYFYYTIPFVLIRHAALIAILFIAAKTKMLDISFKLTKSKVEAVS